MILDLINFILLVQPHAQYCMPLAIPLIMAAAQFAWGAHQKSQADSDLKNLGDAPNYSVSPEVQGAYDRALEMSDYGFTPQEKSSFRQNVAQDINTKTQRALDLGGGSLSKVISGIGKIDEMGAENKFAVSDANVHRQNISKANSLARDIQSQKNRATGASIHEYDTKRNYDEQAGAQGVQNMFGGLNIAGMGLSHLSPGASGGTGGAKLASDGMGGTDTIAKSTNPYSQYQTDFWDNYT